eukprot:m.229695 g.229695  ORF g.229695 m.229695 type:complete len:551 (+) comp11945_c0_seq1:62-1714(+)
MINAIYRSRGRVCDLLDVVGGEQALALANAALPPARRVLLDDRHHVAGLQAQLVRVLRIVVVQRARLRKLRLGLRRRLAWLRRRRRCWPGTATAGTSSSRGGRGHPRCHGGGARPAGGRTPRDGGGASGAGTGSPRGGGAATRAGGAGRAASLEVVGAGGGVLRQPLGHTDDHLLARRLDLEGRARLEAQRARAAAAPALLLQGEVNAVAESDRERATHCGLVLLREQRQEFSLEDHLEHGVVVLGHVQHDEVVLLCAERHGADLIELEAALEDLDDLALVRALGNLLAANEVDRVRRQHQVAQLRAEATVVLVDRVRKLDALALANHGTERRVVRETDVVSNEVAVDGARAAVLLVEQDVRRLLLELLVVLLGLPAAVCNLDHTGVSIEFALADLLEQKERLGVLDEHLGLAQLPLVAVHLHRLHQVLDALAHVALPLRPRLLGQDGVPTQELVELATEGKAGAADPDVLLQTEVDDLVLAAAAIPVVRLLVFVRLDAAQIVRCALHQRLDEVVGLRADLAAGRRGLLLPAVLVDGVGVVGEQVDDETL